jgi:hypothetical protein
MRSLLVTPSESKQKILKLLPNIMTDQRQYALATQCNREPILNILLEILPSQGKVLEIASGTGEHAIFFAPCLQPRTWIPSDISSVAIASIAAWQQHYQIPNLTAPLILDVTDPNWSKNPDLLEQNIQAIVNINMIHISPWEACLGLFAGAENLLPINGILYLYGAYKQNGQHISPSNVAFDRSLRLQNPEWGVRNLEDVINVASKHKFKLQQIQSMPANNLSVIFQKIA